MSEARVLEWRERLGLKIMMFIAGVLLYGRLEAKEQEELKSLNTHLNVGGKCGGPFSDE